MADSKSHITFRTTTRYRLSLTPLIHDELRLGHVALTGQVACVREVRQSREATRAAPTPTAPRHQGNCILRRDIFRLFINAITSITLQAFSFKFLLVDLIESYSGLAGEEVSSKRILFKNLAF